MAGEGVCRIESGGLVLTCCTGKARVLPGNGLRCSFNKLEEASPPSAQILARKGT